MKITIIGAGNVGSQAACYAAIKNLADVVLVDVVEGLPQGKALDLAQSMSIPENDVKIVGSNSYEDTKDSDIVVVTAGVARKPGMSRDDLVEINAKIMKSVIPEVVKQSPNSILIIVSNPLDVMVQLAYQLSGFAKEKVIGMAGVLDSARFKLFLAEETKAKMSEIEAITLGSHGDLMVPVISHCKIEGKNVTEVLSSEKIAEIVKRTQNGGAEIVNLLKTGSAFFAPGLAIVEMCEAILKDQQKILPCSVLVQGEYGINDVFVGVPVKLGKNGAEEVVELELNEEEKQNLIKSANHVKIELTKQKDLLN